MLWKLSRRVKPFSAIRLREPNPRGVHTPIAGFSQHGPSRDSSKPESQFTNRRMRMFITMPNARNMNSTDDPP